MSVTEKRCRVCGEMKPLDQFSKRRRDGDSLRNECRACGTAAAVEWHKQNPERTATINERSRAKNYERILLRNRRKQSQNTIRQRELRQRNRAAVLDHYGHACACCGATDMLTIDHIDGNGLQHRRETDTFSAGHQMNRWLIKNEFPPGFQVLCLSCNASKKQGPACRLEH